MSTVGARGCCAVLCAHDIPNPFPHALLQREDARLPLSVLSPFGQVYRDSTVLPRSRPSAAKRAAFSLELSSAVDVRSNPPGMALSPFGIVRQHLLFPRAAPRTPAVFAPAAPRLLRHRIGAGPVSSTTLALTPGAVPRAARAHSSSPAHRRCYPPISPAPVGILLCYRDAALQTPLRSSDLFPFFQNVAVAAEAVAGLNRGHFRAGDRLPGRILAARRSRQRDGVGLTLRASGTAPAGEAHLATPHPAVGAVGDDIHRRGVARGLGSPRAARSFRRVSVRLLSPSPLPALLLGVGEARYLADDRLSICRAVTGSAALVGVRCSPCYVCSRFSRSSSRFPLHPLSLGIRDSGQTTMRIRRPRRELDPAREPPLAEP